MDKKRDFPVFKYEPNLVYLDSAATTHKPNCVIEAMGHQMACDNGSPHRGAYRASVKATEDYESSKAAVARLIGADATKEIVYTKNATEALNLLAYGYGLHHVLPGQNLVVAITAHHSNLVPWQMVAKAKGAELRYLKLEESGDWQKSSINQIDEQTALVAFPLVSNAYGVIHPAEPLIKKAKQVGAATIVDAAQAVGHMPLSVQTLDCDFLVFSGHKIFGPQGIGVLYGREAMLEKVQPFLRGGDMIEYVSEQEASFAELPKRLEAGTQNVTGAVGLKAAIEFIEAHGLDSIQRHEQALVAYALESFEKLPYVRVIGPRTAENRGALISFTIDGVHPHDAASLLDDRGIAIRAGHHCCQPLMKHLGLAASCRVSFSIYNSKSDIDALMDGIKHTREVFGYGE